MGLPPAEVAYVITSVVVRFLGKWEGAFFASNFKEVNCFAKSEGFRAEAAGSK